MIGKKLTNLLAALDAMEFRRFRKLLRSPVYTSNPHHLKLYDALKRYHPTFDSPYLINERIFEKVYPDQLFDSLKFRMLASQFTRLVEDYLLLLEQERDDFERKKQLVKIYNRRNLYHFFEKGTKALLTTLEASPYRDMDYYLNHAQLNEARYFHPLKNKYDLKDTSFEDLMESFDRYFVLGKMRLGIAMKNVERILSKTYDLRFQKAIEQDIIFQEEDTLFQLYQLSFQLLKEQKEDCFEALEPLLLANIDSLSKEDRQLLFYTSLNFISRQLNIGNTAFSKKAFEWNKLGLDQGLFLEQQKINEHIFGNIVIVACREEQFEWAIDFIQSNQKYLDPKIAEDVANYNRGLLFFYQKDFDEAIAVLQNYSFSPAYLLKTRLTLVRAAFEKFLLAADYFSTLIYQAEAFEITLRRSKTLSASIKKPYLNTILIIKRLAAKIRANQSKQNIEAWLKKELIKKSNIVAKAWLLEKIEASVSV